jgi:hypothetical protein
MSGDSIDALTVNKSMAINNNKKNYCGIYHLNTTQTCIIDADSVSNDSAIQTTTLSDNNCQQQKGVLEMSKQQCNYQLERFEKLYYEGENCNSNNNSLNITVSKHLNRHQPVRGSFV